MPGTGTPPSDQPAGPAADAQGRTVIDPTKNVETLVYQQNKRQDDLRGSELRGMRREIRLEVRGLRDTLMDFKEYQKAIADAETKRIDAIRAVDVAAVAVANTAAENRATTLAGQVNAAKDAQIVALKAETDPIRKDIGDLRQSQWTIAGGRVQERETVGDGQAKGSNIGMWIGIGVSVLAILVSGFFTTMALGVTIFFATR